MLVRATDDTPYVSSYSRLFLREFDHVVTIYLPLNNREGRWASDIYEKQLVEAIERYHPTTIASIDIDFTEFDNLRTKFGTRLKKLTPIDIGEHQCLLFKGLDKFLDKVGLSDKKFVLLHRPEQGELFDDRVRACGFPDVEAKEVSTIGELREVLRDVDGEHQVIINALPYVTDVEFGTHVFPKDIHRMLRVMHVLDISVVSTDGAISAINDYPVINMQDGVVVRGGVLIFVRPKRLNSLGLGSVPISGMMYVDGIIR